MSESPAVLKEAIETALAQLVERFKTAKVHVTIRLKLVSRIAYNVSLIETYAYTSDGTWQRSEGARKEQLVNARYVIHRHPTIDGLTIAVKYVALCSSSRITNALNSINP